jgi:hypothetical protein
MFTAMRRARAMVDSIGLTPEKLGIPLASAIQTPGRVVQLDQMTAAERFAKAAYRVDRAEDIGRGIARRSALRRPAGSVAFIWKSVLGEIIDADLANRRLRP